MPVFKNLRTNEGNSKITSASFNGHPLKEITKQLRREDETRANLDPNWAKCRPGDKFHNLALYTCFKCLLYFNFQRRNKKKKLTSSTKYQKGQF